MDDLTKDFLIKEKLEKIKGEGREARERIREQTLGYVLGAFGLVAGLAWNEAVSSLISYVFPLSKNSIWAKFAYAGLITLFIVLVSSFLTKMLRKKEE